MGSSIHGQQNRRDIRRRVGAEPERRLRDFVRRSPATQHAHLSGIRFVIRSHGRQCLGGHLGQDGSRRNRVDSDVASPFSLAACLVKPTMACLDAV